MLKGPYLSLRGPLMGGSHVTCRFKENLIAMSHVTLKKIHVTSVTKEFHYYHGQCHQMSRVLGVNTSRKWRVFFSDFLFRCG